MNKCVFFVCKNTIFLKRELKLKKNVSMYINKLVTFSENNPALKLYFSTIS